MLITKLPAFDGALRAKLTVVPEVGNLICSFSINCSLSFLQVCQLQKITFSLCARHHVMLIDQHLARIVYHALQCLTNVLAGQTSKLLLACTPRY